MGASVQSMGVRERANAKIKHAGELNALLHALSPLTEKTKVVKRWGKIQRELEGPHEEGNARGEKHVSFLLCTPPTCALYFTPALLRRLGTGKIGQVKPNLLSTSPLWCY